MAIYDSEEQKLVVRVVYDGQVSVGKTTNLRQLCQFFTTRRRSELFVPEELGGRTIFFDWLQIEAGFVGGHPLRCHFVTVPGQTVLNHRRRHLLSSADAVVFVCDSSPKGVAMARPVLDSLYGELGDGEIPLIVQANKQDLPNVVEEERLRGSLDLAMDIPVVGAIAERGVGVRETAVLAIRAAATRVQRELLESGIESLGGVAESGETLHQALLSAERVMDLSPVQTLLARINPGERAAQTPAEASHDVPTTMPEVLERPEPPLPTPLVPSGHIWPTPQGRDVLRAALGEPLRRRDDLVAQPGASEGSGKSDVVIYRAASWCLKTSERRRFGNAAEARSALRKLVQAKLRLGPMRPPSSVLSLQEDGEQFWLWTVTPWLTTLRGRMTAAEESGDETSLGDALAVFARAAVASMVLAARENLCLDVHPSNFAAREEDLWYLDDDIGTGDGIPTIGYALLHRVDEYSHRPAAMERYLGALEAMIPSRLSKEEVLRLELEEAIEQSLVRTDEAKAARARLAAAVSQCRADHVKSVR